jgi:hypothetical protein
VGNNSAQNTYSSWVEQDTLELGFADRELGRPVDPACGHAAPSPVRRATPCVVLGSTVREAPTPLLPPGERVGAPNRNGRRSNLGSLRVGATIPSLFGAIAMGHTQIPIASNIFHASRSVLNPVASQLPSTAVSGSQAA